MEGGLGRRPPAEEFAAAPCFGNEFEDREIAESLAGGAGDFFRDGEEALAVVDNAVLLTSAGIGRVPREAIESETLVLSFKASHTFWLVVEYFREEKYC